VIRNAAKLALEIGPGNSFFDWWQSLYEQHTVWANEHTIAPLLAGFGASLVERSVLDAFCRATGTTVFEAIRNNTLSIELAAVRESLAGFEPCDVLGDAPLRSIAIRQTVGLGDPLTDGDIAADDAFDDGLPHSLAAGIHAYGLNHFKVKLLGDPEQDRERLLQLAHLFQTLVQGRARFTLDGNENYGDVPTFREHWEFHRANATVRALFTESLLFVEQPIHRDRALNDDIRTQLADWPTAPQIIIDESDAEFSSLPRALELGYSGTSHKNCKGIIKGIANAATIAIERSRGRTVILSAEDLGSVGPVSMLQDLAIVAALGISHAERNGHHYFRGLSAFSDSEQQCVLQNHGDLYRRHIDGFPTLNITNGCVNCRSVVEAPFGVVAIPDMTAVDEV
jgi:hypothetical protein